MILKTKRLILRKPGKKDIKDLIEGLNNRKVSKYLSDVPYPYKKKDAKWWINNCKKEFRKKKKESYPFNIELKDERKLVGGIGIIHVNDFVKSAEIGYWVNEKYWRQGIVSEALLKILDFIYKKLKLNRVVITAFSENKASNNVIKKFHFKLEGIKRESHRSKSTKKLHNLNMYSLLRREWPKVKKRLRR